MGDKRTFGSFGDVAFQFQTSPVYGSYSESKTAQYSEHKRIVTKGADGKLVGQKPLRQINGLSLQTISFSCRISSIVLTTLDLNILEKLALATGAGKFIGSALGDPKDYTTFFTEVDLFVNQLTEYLETQEAQSFFVGDAPKGDFTLNSLSKSVVHKPDGKEKIVDLEIELVEWVKE